MDSFVVPTDVETALAGAGFQPVEVAGSGWLAVALDGSERRLELHVVPTVADAGMTERAARLCAVRHEHLPQVLDVVELSSGRLGLVVEHVEGLSLAQIRAARAPLADGEAATVAIPVAGALAALHDAGLSHGAVSESTIVVRPDGRPALTDLRGALGRSRGRGGRRAPPGRHGPRPDARSGCPPRLGPRGRGDPARDAHRAAGACPGSTPTGWSMPASARRARNRCGSPTPAHGRPQRCPRWPATVVRHGHRARPADRTGSAAGGVRLASRSPWWPPWRCSRPVSQGGGSLIGRLRSPRRRTRCRPRSS